MAIVDNTSEEDVTTIGGDTIPPCVGPATDALPEVQPSVLPENSHIGVSTHYAPLPKELQDARRAVRAAHWYVLRCTYGKEGKAYDYIVNNHGVAYYPTVQETKLINGKRKTVVQSWLPNLLFVYGTFDAVKAFVYDNVHEETKPLRFYCIHSYEGSSLELIPMTLTEAQMRSIQRIHENLYKDVIVSSDTIQKFEKGELVRVVEGKFAGVVGRVARFRGQQRVGITINGLYTIVTAYVPKAFLKPISGHRQRVLDVAPHNDEGDENPSE